MERKLGINANCLHDLTELEALPLIKEAGFENFFTGAYRREDVAVLKETADKLDLTYEFIHAPFRGINEMWMPGMGYLTMYNAMKESIDAAALYQIPYVITHVSSGWTPPEITDMGLARYDDLVIYAKEKGVIVAFENLRMVGNLSYFSDRYAGMDNVRFCFDVGHENCYTKTVKWLDIFTNRVCCTHIHDNMGRPLYDKTGDPDTHLLPFDGNCDYAEMMRKLDFYGYTGSLTLEVGQHVPAYQKLSPKEFLATCYERLTKIAKM